MTDKGGILSLSGEKKRTCSAGMRLAARQPGLYAVIRCDLCQNAESVFLCVSSNQG